MTPAEKVVQRLEYGDGYPITVTDLDAAAIIRRLSAALVEAYDGLLTDDQWKFQERHADALRDIKEQA